VVAGAVAGSAELDVTAALEDAVEDGLGQIRIMEDVSPGGKRLVRGEEQWLALEIALVDDLEENVGSAVLEAQIADLIDNEHGQTGEFREAVEGILKEEPDVNEQRPSRATGAHISP
jgi:hypothetical protein